MSARPLPEHRESMWVLVLGPAIWALHFLVCYAAAAVYCARWAGRDGDLEPVRLLIAALTLLALLGIGLTGLRGYRRHRYPGGAPPHDAATAEDRHRFMGFATLLLCGLSAVATLYVAMAALFFESCR